MMEAVGAAAADPDVLVPLFAVADIVVTMLNTNIPLLTDYLVEKTNRTTGIEGLPLASFND